jgi:hypothetical protein
MTMTQQDTGNIQGAIHAPPEPGIGINGKDPGMKPRIHEDTLNLIRIIICIALLVPIIQLYFTIPVAISMWVADMYVPFVNIIYFALAIAGGIWLIRYTFLISEEERKRINGREPRGPL